MPKLDWFTPVHVHLFYECVTCRGIILIFIETRLHIKIGKIMKYRWLVHKMVIIELSFVCPEVMGKRWAFFSIFLIYFYFNSALVMFHCFVFY